MTLGGCHRERSDAISLTRLDIIIGMMPEKEYCVYIMTNKTNTTLYTGVTNNLLRRIMEHRNKSIKGFTSHYNICKLVYYEITHDVQAAIIREKQIKAGSRKKKIDLINSLNPEWKDLYEELYG